MFGYSCFTYHYIWHFIIVIFQTFVCCPSSLFNKYKLLIFVINIEVSAFVCSFIRFFFLVGWLLIRMVPFCIMRVPVFVSIERKRHMTFSVYTVSSLKPRQYNLIVDIYLFIFFIIIIVCISWIKEDTWVQSSEYLYFEFVNICCINSHLDRINYIHSYRIIYMDCIAILDLRDRRDYWRLPIWSSMSIISLFSLIGLPINIIQIVVCVHFYGKAKKKKILTSCVGRLCVGCYYFVQIDHH